MPVKKEKKITKKLVKKPVKKVVKQKQTQRQSVNQKQNVIVNVHTGKSASQGKSKSKASGSSKVERVVPMPNYQASESPYPSYMRQSVAVPVMQEPVQAGNPAFASVGQTVGPIPNRIPVFPDAPQQPTMMPEEPPAYTEPPPVTKKTRQRKPKPTKQATPVIENVPVISNVGIESESGIANIFTPVKEPVVLKSPVGGAFSSIFPPVEKQPSAPPSGSRRIPTMSKKPYPLTRKSPAGSRKDLEQRYYNLTGNTWTQDKKDKFDFQRLKKTVEDKEAGVMPEKNM